jgi:hypothetical protein
MVLGVTRSDVLLALLQFFYEPSPAADLTPTD